MSSQKWLHDISVVDLRTEPVWVFLGDSPWDDSKSIHPPLIPYRGTLPVQSDDGSVIVSAKFHLADGTMMCGYISPPSFPLPTYFGHRLGSMVPTVVVEEGHVPLWAASQGLGSEEVERRYKLLGKESEQVFPLYFCSLVEFGGGVAEATIEGFFTPSSFRVTPPRWVR